METSLRYASDSKALRIHAKEKFPIDSNTHLQVHGELNTGTGTPCHGRALIRYYYPDLAATLGVGLQYDKKEKLRYTIRGKKSFPVTADGLLSFNVKGRCDADQEFKERKSRAAAELSWSIFNFQKNQDVRIKVGYEIFDKVPYLQIRENNWTLNTDYKGVDTELSWYSFGWTNPYSIVVRGNVYCIHAPNSETIKCLEKWGPHLDGHTSIAVASRTQSGHILPVERD